MGSSCSSGQAHKDKDSVSTHSEESPSYKAASGKGGNAQQETSVGGGGSSAGEGRAERDGTSSSSSLVATSASRKNDPGPLSPPTPSTPSTATAGPPSCEPKTNREGFFRSLKDVAPSSISDSMSLSSTPGATMQSPKGFDRPTPLTGKGGDGGVPGTTQLAIPPELHQLPSALLALLTGRSLGAPVVCTPGAVSGTGGQIAPAAGIPAGLPSSGSGGLLRSPDRCSKISIYVCAADSQDCCVEKGLLHKVVYPRLRDYCRDSGFEVHIVDLHWKTALEKQQDHEFPELCLGELSRQMEVAFVIPVLFLSHSLGTPLLPKTVENQDFKAAVGRAVDPGDRDLLQKWYKLDSHAQPPCYRLQPIASHIPGFKDSSDEKEKALREWRTEIERTLAVMVNVFPQELRDTYLTTVVEQEVHNTVFMSQELAKRCIWLCRVISSMENSDREDSTTGSDSSPPSCSHGQAELKRRLKILQSDLRNQLSEKHILRLPVEGYRIGEDERREEGPEGGVISSNGTISPSVLVENPCYVEEVTERLWYHLKEISEVIMEESQVKTTPKPTYGIESSFFQELDQQATFCQQAAQCSVNRNSLLQDIKNYVTGDSHSPMIVHGPTGCGKTTLLARTAQSCLTWCPDAFVLARFVGATAESLMIEQILRSLTQQCAIIAYGQPYHIIHNLSTYTKSLKKILSEASAAQKKLIIIIDGIDQVKRFGPDISTSWIPLELPNNVKIILSVDNKGIWYENLQNKLNEESPRVEVLPLKKEEAQTILMASVMQYNHIVNNHLQDCVRSSVQECTLPLYVKMLAWQTSWWSDKDHDIVPRGNIKDQINSFLDELEVFLGKVRVQHAFALMAASRFGLTDSEMLDLLAHDKSFHSDATYVPWAPACLFWAQLNKFLRPLVRWVQVGGYGLTQWRDFSLNSVIKDRYLPKDAPQDVGTSPHSTLTDYFSGKWVEENLPEMTGRLITQPIKSENCYNRRKLDELPYQVFSLEGTIKEKFLFDPTWLVHKLCGSDVYQVLEDILMEKDWSQCGDLCLLKQWLEESSTALNYDGCQFYTQAYIRLEKIIDAARSEGTGDQDYPFIQGLLKASLNPPIASLIPGIPENIDDMNKYLMSLVECENGEDKLDEDENHSFDFLCRLPPGKNLVATASSAHEEICVWDIGGSKNDRNNRLEGPMKLCCLQGVPHPVALKPVDGRRVVALCRRELRLYDLENGCLLSRLKGVMNQKMPYYGLHGQGYVAALSRNRMHVNLLHVETGDCVATFKAGEDRFLDSLLVSGDGRILVCGDETQKPFPLLVWDLASRKLLYDLRIPRHDFVTRLAGITYEGHYVCCVCKEVDEPSPNFIVVYDLQSGTLFKKWKPGVDTVSIDISSPEGCVLSGLEDSRILVWDLITGNCRWRLSGHTAPVNVLRLDPSGTCFLSADSEGRDRSLRLWDLHEGKLMAVYTPKKMATAWEVLDRGKTIVLAFKDSTVISALHLKGKSKEEDRSSGEEQKEFFKWDRRECRVFNLCSEEGTVACPTR
ncbi:uncharacterized protein [Hetaerina americana]|uniref:uncharacterized protein isoform X2 n=1 Tax=Hetaerina americana TaxID=62018 RepID=UPI003A7F1418